MALRGGNLILIQVLKQENVHVFFPVGMVGGALQYKREAHGNTNGRSTDAFPFHQSSGEPKLLQYNLEAYCNASWRCTAIPF